VTQSMEQATEPGVSHASRTLQAVGPMRWAWARADRKMVAPWRHTARPQPQSTSLRVLSFNRPNTLAYPTPKLDGGAHPMPLTAKSAHPPNRMLLESTEGAPHLPGTMGREGSTCCQYPLSAQGCGCSTLTWPQAAATAPFVGPGLQLHPM